VTRRTFILYLVAATAGMPITAIGQARRIPVVGFLRHTSQRESQFLVDALEKGLREAGFLEKQKVAFEYQFADGRYERLPSLAKELVGRKVDVLVAGGVAASQAAKSASATIPIVFVIGEDPVRMKLVQSLGRPERNVTGVSFGGLHHKRLELFHLLAPRIKAVAYLLDPNDPVGPAQLKDVQDAARALGISIIVFEAGSEPEIQTAFDTLAKQGLRALHVGGSGLFLGKRDRIVSLATQHSILTTFSNPEGAEAGALMSYGASTIDAYRQAGLYVGRILKGAKPAELPVLQASKPELIINLKTAKTFRIDIPQSVLQRTDRVIE